MSTKNMEQTYLAHTYITGSDTEKAFLAHHGILGMKWGIRRFQNKDGSLTSEGKKRYSEENEPMNQKISARTKESFEKMRNSASTDEEKDERVNSWERARDTDMYEMNFLEAIQNAEIFQNHNQDAMLDEYAKYLTDRQNYMENDAYKLKYAH